jgi:hypothetical protein
VIELPVGKLRIITPTQSVMDRLAAAYAWKDALEVWFANEGESKQEYRRFRDAVGERKKTTIST